MASKFIELARSFTRPGVHIHARHSVSLSHSQFPQDQGQAGSPSALGSGNADDDSSLWQNKGRTPATPYEVVILRSVSFHFNQCRHLFKRHSVGPARLTQTVVGSRVARRPQVPHRVPPTVPHFGFEATCKARSVVTGHPSSPNLMHSVQGTLLSESSTQR